MPMPRNPDDGQKGSAREGLRGLADVVEDGMAESPVPQGQSKAAIPSLHEAKLVLPKGRQSSGEANRAVPQGRSELASPDPAAAKANRRVPQGHPAGAEARSDEATDKVPQGRRRIASSVSTEAGPALPKGHRLGASTLPAKATPDVPQGHSAIALSVQGLVDQIRAAHRVRCYFMDQRKRAHLSLGAFLRRQLGWSLNLPDADRKRIATTAAELIEAGERAAKGKPPAPPDEALYASWRHVIGVSLATRAPFENAEKDAKAAMVELVEQLPVWRWAENVRGLGAASLGTIVGEAGDLAAYPAKGHLWKRMGVAPRDGKAFSTWRRTGGLTADDWTDAGYSPMRRSRMFVIGEVMVKTPGSAYRQVYLDRKEYERAEALRRGLTVCPAGKIPKGRAAEFISDGWIHLRAQRYMEKRLLRDLWQAWRTAQ
jgi:hypothetical protein